MAKMDKQMKFSKFRHNIQKYSDILLTDLRHLLPCLCRWLYRSKVRREIICHRITSAEGKKASLFQHGHKSPSPKRVLLLLHGLYAHPFITLHLADLLQSRDVGAIFSLYLSYDLDHLENHRALLRKGIDTIEQLITDTGGTFSGIDLIGHSMGAIEGAYMAYVEQERRVSSVTSIAGRLRGESTTP